jgi:uncharacterized protein (TIGR00369 family)
MDARNKLFDEVKGIFDRASFIQHMGIKLKEVSEGACKLEMKTRKEHMQQHGFVHAGVLATFADHGAGGAARSAVAEGKDVITVEFKVNFLRPAPAGNLTCDARVLRAGKTVVVAEAEVYSGETMVTKLTSTLAVIPAEK